MFVKSYLFYFPQHLLQYSSSIYYAKTNTCGTEANKNNVMLFEKTKKIGVEENTIKPITKEFLEPRYGIINLPDNWEKSNCTSEKIINRYPSVELFISNFIKIQGIWDKVFPQINNGTKIAIEAEKKLFK